jgi:hypothetical protein
MARAAARMLAVVSGSAKHTKDERKHARNSRHDRPYKHKRDRERDCEYVDELAHEHKHKHKTDKDHIEGGRVDDDDDDNVTNSGGGEGADDTDASVCDITRSDDGSGKARELCEPVEPRGAFGTNAKRSKTKKRVRSDEEVYGKKLWNTLSPIFRYDLAHVCLDGATVPTYTQLARYDDIVAYLTSRMKRTCKPSGLHVPIVRTLIMRELGVPASCCSMAMVTAAIWQSGLCDKDAWRSARCADAMYVQGEFYADETRFNHVRKSLFHDARVPVRFKHRVAAAVAVVSHASANPRLLYICCGMDFFLVPLYTYYQALRREMARHGLDAVQCSRTCMTVRDWCTQTNFFQAPRLQRAVAMEGTLDNALLQDVPFRHTRDERQYMWLPAIAYYLAVMETVSSAIIVTDAVARLRDVESWEETTLLCVD